MVLGMGMGTGKYSPTLSHPIDTSSFNMGEIQYCHYDNNYVTCFLIRYLYYKSIIYIIYFIQYQSDHDLYDSGRIPFELHIALSIFG